MMKTFIPSKIKNFEVLGITTLSTEYWEFALEMERKANEEFNSNYWKNSFYVFPAVVFFCSAVEALINELLAIHLYVNSNLKEEQIVDITEIKEGRNNYREIKNKISSAITIFSSNHSTFSYDEIIQNYSAIVNLRNSIIHFNPALGNLNEWPAKLKALFDLSNVEVYPSDWNVTFSRKNVLDFAKKISTEIIEIFLGLNRVDKKSFFDELNYTIDHLLETQN